MKYSRFMAGYTVLFCALNFACNDLANIDPKIPHPNSDSIEWRSPDECEPCFDEAACCCYFELTPGANPLGPLYFEICGVQPNTYENTSCSLSTGHSACYTFGSDGQNFSLSVGGITREWFCIAPNGAFAIQSLNANNVNARIQCSSDGNGSGTTSFTFTPYLSGSGHYIFYFLLEECDVDFPCDI